MSQNGQIHFKNLAPNTKGLRALETAFEISLVQYVFRVQYIIGRDSSGFKPNFLEKVFVKYFILCFARKFIFWFGCII